MKLSARLWLVPAFVAGAATFIALVVAVMEFCARRDMESANWAMAAGGLGLIVFTSIQLHREVQREGDRVVAARAKLKPVAWLARRMCEQAVIESQGKPMENWLARWYTPTKQRMMESGGPPDTIDVLQNYLQEVVTLAAEAGGREVSAADHAFTAFITAANTMNDVNATYLGGDAEKYQAAVTRVRSAATQLATAAEALTTLAPRTVDEPVMPATPRFVGELTHGD